MHGATEITRVMTMLVSMMTCATGDSNDDSRADDDTDDIDYANGADHDKIGNQLRLKMLHGGDVYDNENDNGDRN